jgi:hypothetical protein
LDTGGVLLEWNPRYLYRKLFADTTEMERFLFLAQEGLLAKRPRGHIDTA